MSQNKRKENANHYYDPRALENYCRNDILFTFELAGRQAGKLIAKGELEMRRNELQAMLHDANQLIKRIYETKECGNSGCDARCRYNAICEAAHMTYKLIKRQVDLYNIKRSVKDDNN